MFDKIGFFLGYLKLFMYKLCYGKKLKFSLHIRFMPSSKIRIAGNGKLILGNNFRSRYNILLKVEDDAQIHIENNVFINDNSTIVCKDSVNIGKDTVIASGVMIYDHDHVYGQNIKVGKSDFRSEKINIGENVWIGLNSVILSGAEIGDNSVIAAGTIIKKSVPDNVLVYDKRDKTERNLG